jgi:hypothetical protein
MDRIAAMTAFAKVVETGSLSAAGRALELFAGMSGEGAVRLGPCMLRKRLSWCSIEAAAVRWVPGE